MSNQFYQIKIKACTLPLLTGADLRTDDTNVSELVRIANRWSRLSRVGLKAELCERGANPRQRIEFQYETLVEY